MRDAPIPDANMDVGGTDSAPALQALLDAGRPLPPGVYGVGSTLTLHGKGLVLEGAWRGRGGPTDTTVGTWLVWQGPPGGTLLDVRGMQCVVRGVGIASARSTSLDRGINVDAPADTGLISTRHLLSNLSVDGRYGAVAKGVVFGESGCANNEFMRVQAADFFNCTYAGVAVPNGTDQSEFYQFEDVTFSACDYGYAGARASGDFFRCNLSWLRTAFFLNGGTGRPVAFRSCTSEGCKQFLNAYGAASVSLEDCRLAMNAYVTGGPPGTEFFYGGNELVLKRLTLEDSPSAAGYVRPTNNGNLEAENVLFQSPSPFVTDGDSSYRLTASGVRLAGGQLYLPDGTYYNHYPIYPALSTDGPPRSLGDALAALKSV